MNEKRVGLWRATFNRTGKPKPKRCDECKSKDLDYDRLLDWDWYNAELATDHGVIDDHDSRFSFTPLYAVCEQCNNSMEYGAFYYFNPETNDYDLPEPLSFAQGRKNDLLFERDSLLAAGQLELLL